MSSGTQPPSIHSEDPQWPNPSRTREQKKTSWFNLSLSSHGTECNGEMWIWRDRWNISSLKPMLLGRTSLVAQWLRLCAPNAEVPGSIPGQGTMSHMWHKDRRSFLSAATKIQCSQINKYPFFKKCSFWLLSSFNLLLFDDVKS